MVESFGKQNSDSEKKYNFNLWIIQSQDLTYIVLSYVNMDEMSYISSENLKRLWINWLGGGTILYLTFDAGKVTSLQRHYNSNHQSMEKKLGIYYTELNRDY